MVRMKGVGRIGKIWRRVFGGGKEGDREKEKKREEGKGKRGEGKGKRKGGRGPRRDKEGGEGMDAREGAGWRLSYLSNRETLAFHRSVA